MPEDSVKLFSTVKPTLLRSTLLKGSFVAICGVLVLVYFGAFLPPKLLGIWGIPILVVGAALIAIGLIPYRLLTRLESTPSEIIVTDVGYLQYFSLGKQRYSVPMELIDKIDFIETKRDYGIALILKRDCAKKIVVHDSGFDMGKWQRRSRKKFGCDLFIPYFSRRSFTRLSIFSTLYNF